MFPLNDFNFVACALATFSAAVGYNVSRRRGRTSSGRAEDKQSRIPFLRNLKSHRRGSTANARSSSPTSTSASQSQSQSQIQSQTESTAQVSAAGSQSQSECGTPARTEADESLPADVEDGSLKRKRSPTPEIALSDTPPSKRRRTPPPPDAPDSEGHLCHSEYDEFAVKVEERTPALPREAAEDAPQSEHAPALAPASDSDSYSESVAHAVSQTDAVGCPKPNAHERTAVPVPEPGSEGMLDDDDAQGSSQPGAALISAETSGCGTTTPCAAAPAPTAPPAAPTPQVFHIATAAQPVRPASPRAPLPLPVWHHTSAIVAAKPSSAFQAFTGQSSAFASTSSGSSSASAFGNAGCFRKPAWSAAAGASNFGETSAAFASSESNPLAAPEPSTSAQKVATVTGEEEEEVACELKGAKVFIKRGERDFCEGILGHAKLLKHKATGAERILFRREPIWKVSMSVRLRPAVRCSFDEAQGALRVTLKEQVEDSQEEQLVIYALRRGKASRTDFAEFARAVVESARAQDQASG